MLFIQEKTGKNCTAPSERILAELIKKKQGKYDTTCNVTIVIITQLGNPVGLCARPELYHL